MTRDPYRVGSPAQLRHALRTPLNHIIGYSEMILEDLRGSAVAGGFEGAIPSLDAIVFSACELVRFVQNAFPPNKAELAATDVSDLQQWLGPHVTDLLGNIAVLRDSGPQYAQDVQRIQNAARRLLAFSQGLSEALDDAVPLPDEPPPERSQAAGGHLLVVDDSPQNRDILRRTLERNGHRVALAENGSTALDRIRAASFDLILLDVLMPVMDGYALLQQLKATQEFRAIPVIMISALDESSAVVRCVQMGAEDYIMKPFDPILVRTRVQATLDRWRTRRQLDTLRSQVESILIGSANKPVAELLDELRKTVAGYDVPAM
ncbi:MAG: response regulator [Acidobacteriaceae bacterium]|nr:response regulator [Acidobacteriaceae bacterium]